MSNALAIAACTATLRNLLLAGIPALDSSLSDLQVTTQPPDLARRNVTTSQLNVFLYQTVVNAAWRNLDMPRQVRPGETGAPPLPLNLHYLLTAYGRGENDNDAVSLDAPEHCTDGIGHERDARSSAALPRRVERRASGQRSRRAIRAAQDD